MVLALVAITTAGCAASLEKVLREHGARDLGCDPDRLAIDPAPAPLRPTEVADFDVRGCDRARRYRCYQPQGTDVGITFGPPSPSCRAADDGETGTGQ
jgi:hypothetical protein